MMTDLLIFRISWEKTSKDAGILLSRGGSEVMLESTSRSRKVKKGARNKYVNRKLSQGAESFK